MISAKVIVKSTRRDIINLLPAVNFTEQGEESMASDEMRQREIVMDIVSIERERER